MGSRNSTPEQEPSQQQFDKPWRAMPWGQKDIIEEKLRSFRLSSSDARFVRILLVGEVGSGKSSFINSVNNAFQKRITCGALVASVGETFTKEYKTHYIEGEDGSPLPFVFNDVMGLEPDQNKGVQPQDMVTAVHGFLQEEYKFNPLSPVTPKDVGYRSDPSKEDQPFCLVNIIAADQVAFMTQEVFDKMKQIRQAATSLNMPQVIIMTRADRLCPLVDNDIRKIYSSKKIKDKMQVCSHRLGVPMNHIFPVKNYHEEIDTDDDVDLLILKALDQIVHIAADAMKRTSSNHPPSSIDKPE